MKDNLIKHLDELYDNLLDYRSRLLNAKIECEKSGELDSDAIEGLDQIRYSMSYTEDRVAELKEQINKRVYCVQVTSNVEMIVKVLAKNEDDAVEWATSICEKRIRQTLGEQYDVDVYSEGYSLGDESPNDDEADEEYPYDE